MNRKKETTNYYLQDAGDLYEKKRFSDIKGNYVDALEKQALLDLIGDVRSKEILEVGCGTARFSSMLQDMGANVISMDYSQTMLKFAKSKVKRGEFTQGDIEQLPVKDNSFDVVFGIRILIHYNDPKKAVLELLRVVKNDGIVLVDNHNLFRLDFLVVFLKRFLNYHPEVYNSYLTPWEIAKKYNIKAMKIERIDGVKIIPPFPSFIKLLGKNRMIAFDRMLGNRRFLKYIGASCFIRYRKQ